jgi:hypothetical protein
MKQHLFFHSLAQKAWKRVLCMFNGAKICNSVAKEIRGIMLQSLFERKIAAHVTK